MRLLAALLLIAALTAGTTIAAAAAAAEPDAPTAPLRLWIDEFFFAKGETELLREAVEASGGAAVLAGATRNRVLQLKSYQQTGRADVLWTGRTGCYEAFRRSLNASHAISCVPGSHALTGKAALAATLEAAYGPAAWGLLPRSFYLPSQYPALASHLRQEQAAGGSSMWVLKEDVHRGKGVVVADPPTTLLRALQRTKGGKRRHVLAQSFLGQQLLVASRPFYIRLWAVLMGADPARAHLWDGGVVVFGSEQHQQPQAGQEQQAAAPAGSPSADPNDLIVNLWTQDRSAAAPWSLAQLEAHLAAGPGGPEAATRLRRRLRAGVTAALAAGLPAAQRAAAGLPGFQGGSFEVFGLDFLLDAGQRPWLVEVNALPSLARKLVGCSASAGSASAGDGASASGGKGAAAADRCQASNPFDVQKEEFVRGLLGLLGERRRQLAAAEARAGAVLQEASAGTAEGQAPPCVGAPQLAQLLALPEEEAAAARLGFVPLTPQLYGSLACMAQARQAANTSNWCAELAELPPPPPNQQQQQAGFGSMAALRGLLQHWGDRLRLEAAWLLGQVQHPRTAWRLRRTAAAPAAPRPLSDANRRMLAWLQRGSPRLDSLQALADFCSAGGEAALAA